MMNATDDFNRFRERRDAERAEEARLRVVFRKATFRYSDGRGRRVGYVGRLGETDVRVYYTKNDDADAPTSEMHEWGDLVGSELVRRGTTGTATEAFDLAKARLLERTDSTELRPTGSPAGRSAVGRNESDDHDEKEDNVSSKTTTKRAGTRRRATTRPGRAASAAATQASVEKEATPKQIRAELVKRLRALDGVAVVPHKDGRFDKFTVEKQAFGLVFAESKSGVALQIPKPLLGVEKDLPKGANFKTTKYGLTRTLKTIDEVPSAVAALDVAAGAVRKKKVGAA